MDCLNYEFFDEFKALDNLCRDIYGGSADNKLASPCILRIWTKKPIEDRSMFPVGHLITIV